MSLKICVFVSGSSGNCIYVDSGQTAVLVDAGLSCRETLKRVEFVGGAAERIRAICITHEHDDHVSSLGPLFRRLGTDLYGNSGTIEGAERNDKVRGLPWKVFRTGEPFTVGDLRIEPFSVPHDAYDPVGFVVSAGESRAGIVTDMGMPTELIRAKLRNCQVVVLESNHEEPLLKESARPWVLKQRILSWQGHLSNAQACGLIADIAGPQLKTVFLAHLSSECNNPELACRLARETLCKCGYPQIDVKMTFADRASEVAEC